MRKVWLLISLLSCGLLLTWCNTLENQNNTIEDNPFWVIHNIEEWTITLTDWNDSIVIMDKNLWSEVAGTWENSYWYHYQWWNNHWFPLDDSITTWYVLLSQEEWSHYWPRNFYDSSIFAVDKWWDNERYNASDYIQWHNNNLWWGSWDYYWLEHYDEYEKHPELHSFDIIWDNGNDRIERKWPCPKWFHVPSEKEWMKLITIWYNLRAINESDSVEKVEFIVDHMNWTENIWLDFMNDFLMPFAWWRRYDVLAELHEQWERGYYWTSSSYNDRSQFVFIYWSWIVSGSSSVRSPWFSIRCFKDPVLDQFWPPLI